MRNPIFDETGDTSLTVAVLIVHADKSVTKTRGTVGVSSRSEGELDGPFSKSGIVLAIPPPENASRPQFAHIQNRRTGEYTSHRINDPEDVGNRFGVPALFDTMICELFEHGEDVPPLTRFFDERFFDPAAFA